MPGTLHIVDVFAEQRYAGNPLAVVTRADSLSSEQMQAIAAEINYSETTFVGSTVNADGSHPVRMFTPAREIAFAGHPILGTAWVIRHENPTPPASVVLDLQVGPVPVVFEADTQGREVCWFTAPPITLGPTCASEPIAAALGLSPGDIDPAGPVQQCGAGTAAMVVPLRSLAALRRCALDLGVYQALAAKVSRRSSMRSAGKRATRATSCPPVSSSRPMVSARIRPPATALPSWAPICCVMVCSARAICRCASSRATKSAVLRSCNCAPAWPMTVL